MGNARDALESARRSIELLEESSGAAEIAAARVIAAWAHLHLGATEEGWRELGSARQETNETIRADVLGEAAKLEALYGDATRAFDHLSELKGLGQSSAWVSHMSLPTEAYVALRFEDMTRAASALADSNPDEPTGSVGHKAYVLAVRAHLKVATESPDAPGAINAAKVQATRQSAGLWNGYCEALQAVQDGPTALARFIRQASGRSRWQLTFVADSIAARLGDLGDGELPTILEEASLRPDRWRSALRGVVDSGGEPSVAAARVLEQIGDSGDVARLRRVAHRYRGRPDAELGRALARRVADRVLIEDQGRVSIRVGDRNVEGSSIRRKVLALLCFLLTRPRYAATRDEVMDALWPDFDPADALNSLNQTVYFLRRVFEPSLQRRPLPGVRAPRVGRDLARSRACHIDKQQVCGPHSVDVTAAIT